MSRNNEQTRKPARDESEQKPKGKEPFMPKMDTLKKAIAEKAIEQDRDKSDAIIQKVKENEIKAEYVDSAKGQLDELKTKITPIFNFAFVLVNKGLIEKGVNPLTQDEQLRLQNFIFSLIDTSIEQDITRFTKVLSQGGNVGAKIYEFIGIFIEILLPRIMDLEPSQKRKSKKNDELIPTGVNL